ncbi:MAG: hypothetical protein IH607_05540, partial [Firmicutes bacterium]|nr:hypothetical protein [Bacillota bacterium]
FYKNLLGDEGYLMHTLPVSTGRLIFSKLLVATVWAFVCVLVIWLAVCILSINEADYQAFLHAFDNASLPAGETILYIAEFAAMSLVSVMGAILCLYACMALSMLFQKHRVAIAFGFFIAASTVVQIVAALLMFMGSGSMSNAATTVETVEVNVGFPAADAAMQSAGMLRAHSYILWYILIAGLFAAGFYALTHFMLKRKLNLQ